MGVIGGAFAFILIVGFFVLILLAMMIKILNEYERGVIFRLGRVLKQAKGPGLILLIPIADRIQKVSLRTIVFDVPPQDVITSDNVTLKVNAVVYYRVVEPIKAVIQVENYLYATSQLSQTTLRAVLGKSILQDILTQREQINHHLQEILDHQTESWGIKVSQVEIKNVDLPQEMQRAMAKQAEAERERLAKVIHAEGELQAAFKLKEAADLMAQSPIALQLRYLQSLVEIASENNSTTIFPVPIDILRPYYEAILKAPK